MKNLTLPLLMLISCLSIGQNFITPENRIIVLGEATIEIPADKVIFNIRLEYSDSVSVIKAYELHKKAESKLVDYLKQLNIPNKNITYSLINVGKEFKYESDTKERKISFGTNQSISVTIDDVKNYADFMMKLINAGFTEVSTSFTSSKENEFHDILIEKAIEVARKKAIIMAKASKREIFRIVKVSDTDESDPNFGYNGNESFTMAATAGDSNSITEIPQTVSKTMKVKVVFSLK